jgi:hypothetical protein
MTRSPILRFAPWFVLLIVVYSAGRWQGANSARLAHDTESTAITPDAESSSPAVENASNPAPIEDRSAVLAREAEALAHAAKFMSVPDARTYAFFENLALEDLPAVTARIEGLAPGNEQDVLFIMAVRRWAELDGARAVQRADAFPSLGTRMNARLAAYEAWGARDPKAAFELACRTEEPEAKTAAVSAALTGAATLDPALALQLLVSAPSSVLDSDLGVQAASRIVSGAYGTGKGETMRELVATLPEGPHRDRMIQTMAAEWGAHYPDETLAWIERAAGRTDAREAAVNALFLSLVQKDPALAAAWGTDFPDDSRRTSYIAAAVQSWAKLDIAGAETWVNEQPSGPHLDGAGYAMAAHFMGRRDMPRSFSWIRRINTIEMRAELLGTLGRMWANQNPGEFRRFLDETSLNRAEIEMLLSKIEPAPAS